MDNQTLRADPVFALLVWWPLAWHGAGGVLAWALPRPWGWWALALWTLLLPPLLCRTCDRRWPVRGTIASTTAAARRWWWLHQLQRPFNHVPVFEDLLRLVPGLYQSWLLMWGARVSLLSVIAPGVAITDRHLVIIARGAVLGHGCILGGHLAVRTPTGWDLIIAPVTVETGALIGARAVLGPGSSVAAGEILPATQALPPCQRWQGGRRVKEPGHA